MAKRLDGRVDETYGMERKSLDEDITGSASSPIEQMIDRYP